MNCKALRTLPLVVLIVVALSRAIAQTDSSKTSAEQWRNATSPDHAVSVRARRSGPKDRTELTLLRNKDNAELAHVDCPGSLSSAAMAATNAIVVWDSRGEAVAVGISSGNASSVFVCVKLASGEFKWIDVSSVEGPNLGVLGRPRSDFVRIQHVPTEWKSGSNTALRYITIKTVFWDKANKRYAISQNVAISDTGEFGWK